MQKIRRMVSRGSSGEEDRLNAEHQRSISSSTYTDTAVGSPEPTSTGIVSPYSVTSTPVASSAQPRKTSFSKLAERLRRKKESQESAFPWARRTKQAARPKLADILSKDKTNKLVNFWNTVDRNPQEQDDREWQPDRVILWPYNPDLDSDKPLPPLPEESVDGSPVKMDTSMLVPSGPDRRKQIQDAKDMYQIVVRNAEKAGSAVPPYQFLELIGKGSFGRVYKCLDKNTSMLVAVKIVNIDDMDFSADPRDRDETVRDFRKEVGILQQLKDSGARNVNLIHDAFDLHSQLWIISDYCTGGSVRTLMRANPTPKLEERFIIAIARELAVAMKHVHDIGVIHRDIKCTNVYVTEEGQIQLGDFGIVGVMDDGASKRTTIIGTPWYMPREMHVDAQSVAQGYGTEVDVWSYGCTIFEMATGTVPNAGIAMERLGSVLETAPRLQGGDYSDALRDFVAFCLNSDPKARPTAAQILSHPYIAHTELEFPTKTLVALIERYTMWEFKGGQRTSLFNPGGAAAPAGADSEDHVNDDTEDWNFSTSASFNQEFGKRYSHMILNNLDAPLGAGLPTSQPQNLSVFEQIQREHKEKSANRGEMSLDRLFNPEAAPYAMFAPPVEPQPAPEPSNDLPLRSNEGASAMRESTVMIDLDADLDSSAQPSFNFDFEDLPTIRARSRRGFDDDEEEEEEDNYQYGQHEEGAGDKRATKDWKFPSLPNTAATAPKRATMDWTFSNAQPAEQDDADATMNLPPLGSGSDLAPGFRPQLKHTATVPLGSFGDYIHSNQQSTGPAPPAGDLSRDSMRSMIDLDLGFSETADQPARPSTASSASGSAGTARTSGDPFDLEDTQSRADRNRFSAHKQWQSDGGATDSNRSSLRNVPMHARGSSLSSSASEMERPIQVPAAAEDVFSLNYDEDDDDVHGLARQPVHLSIPRTAPLDGGNDWPDFSQDYGSPAYSSATASQFPEQDYPLSSNDNFNGTNNMQHTVSHSHDTDSEAFRTPTGPQDLLEFPNVVPPNPAALDEDASAATRAAELDRLLDDMRGALKSTSRALRNRAGLDEADSNEPSGGFSSSLDEETDAGFESAGSVGFRSGVETGDEESY